MPARPSPWRCRWPRAGIRREHQGTALGIAGAGNSGTVLAALFAPGLAVAFGWSNVFGLALIPLVMAFVVYLVFAKDAPECPPPKSLRRVPEGAQGQGRLVVHVLLLRHLRRLRRPGLQSLTIYFNDQYGLTPVTAGYFTAACVFAGSLVRPDRRRAGRPHRRHQHACSVMYVLAAIFLAIVSFGLPAAWMALAVFVLAHAGAWAWATARCSSWCRSASARRSA